MKPLEWLRQPSVIPSLVSTKLQCIMHTYIFLHNKPCTDYYMSLSSHKTDAKPTLLELQLLSNAEGVKIKVMEEVAAQWDGLALHLDFPQGIINIIKNDYPNQTERACQQMFQRWLERADPTWRVLLKALEDIDMNTLASDLRKLL